MGIKVEYVDHMGNDLTPVNAARISHGKQSESLSDRDIKLTRYLAANAHFTPFEHQVLTVIVHCPLYIRSQIHRHRTFSYNEVSRRYTDEEIDFYLPPVEDVRMQSKINHQGSEFELLNSEEALGYRVVMNNAVVGAYRAYKELIEAGIAREQARGILPQCLMTKFYMTGNLRNWVHFLELRLDKHAQKEVRYVAEQVQEIIREKWPSSYDALSVAESNQT